MNKIDKCAYVLPVFGFMSDDELRRFSRYLNKNYASPGGGEGIDRKIASVLFTALGLEWERRSND